jgi:hypothetical protein
VNLYRLRFFPRRDDLLNNERMLAPSHQSASVATHAIERRRLTFPIVQ